MDGNLSAHLPKITQTGYVPDSFRNLDTIPDPFGMVLGQLDFLVEGQCGGYDQVELPSSLVFEFARESVFTMFP